MARLNGAAGAGAAQETIDALRRRYIRQNRELAKTNSIQAQRIHDLEEDLSRLASDNQTLRSEAATLERRVADAEGVVARATQTKAVLQNKLAELNSLIRLLFDATESDGKPSRARLKNGIADASQQEDENEVLQTVAGPDELARLREQDREAREARFQMMMDRMPTIDEDREFQPEYEVPLDADYDDLAERDNEDEVHQLLGEEGAGYAESHNLANGRQKGPRIAVYNEQEQDTHETTGNTASSKEPADQTAGTPGNGSTNRKRKRPSRALLEKDEPKPASDALEPENYSSAKLPSRLSRTLAGDDLDADSEEEHAVKKPRRGPQSEARSVFTPKIKDGLLRTIEVDKENVSVSKADRNGTAAGRRKALSVKSTNEFRRETSEVSILPILRQGKQKKHAADQNGQPAPAANSARGPTGGEDDVEVSVELDQPRPARSRPGRRSKNSELRGVEAEAEKDDDPAIQIDKEEPVQAAEPEVAAPTRSRRVRATVNYAEPSLNRKLRRPDDESRMVNPADIINGSVPTSRRRTTTGAGRSSSSSGRRKGAAGSLSGGSQTRSFFENDEQSGSSDEDGHDRRRRSRPLEDGDAVYELITSSPRAAEDVDDEGSRRGLRSHRRRVTAA